MSHFTKLKTQFKNLVYLEEALNFLNIDYQTGNKLIYDSQLKSHEANLLIPQSNNSDIGFCWNGQEYELIVDLYFWAQDCPLEVFIDKLAQTYANKTIVTESNKQGFQAIEEVKNLDGSIKIVLEHWQ